MRLLIFCLGIALTYSAQAQMVSNAEYFLDNDPGVGNGTAIASFTPGNDVDLNVNINLNGVSEGFHQVFIRFKDASGVWGIYEGRSFYIQPAILGNSSALVADAEYFFDTDPGFGNGIAIPTFSAADTVDLNLNLALTGVPSGFHQVFIRYKQDNGLWGIYEGRTFYIQPAPIAVNNAQLIEAEYFFDTDPGYGNGIALPAFTMADTVDFTANLNVSGVSTGVPHQVYIRFKNENGTWGIYEGREFTRLDCDIPAPDFSFVNPICPGSAVSFTDLSTLVDGSTAYSWDIDNDGATDYTTQGDISHTYSTSGNYDVELKLTNGTCIDSITYTLTVQPTFTENVSADACYNSSMTFADGTTVNNIVADFSQTSVVTSSLGCDSTIVTAVTVLPESTGTDVQSACSSYTWIDGNTYTSSNTTAAHLLTTSEGCDSLVTLNLTIPVINVNVTNNNPTLVADLAGATSYQWVDCNNGNQAINGETNQSFTPTTNGSYAVIITINGCSETSSCELIQTVGLDENGLSNIKLYPNPTNNDITIDLGKAVGQVSVELLDLNGKILFQESHQNTEIIQTSLTNYSIGMYYLRISFDIVDEVIKVIKR